MEEENDEDVLVEGEEEAEDSTEAADTETPDDVNEEE